MIAQSNAGMLLACLPFIVSVLLGTFLIIRGRRLQRRAEEPVITPGIQLPGKESRDARNDRYALFGQCMIVVGVIIVLLPLIHLAGVVLNAPPAAKP